MAANRDKGEVSLTIGETSYILKLTMGAMIAAEEAASTPQREVVWDEIVRKAGAGSAKHSRLMAWAMFLKHHPEMTLDEAGELVDEAGGVEAFGRAFQAAQADPKDVSEMKATAGVTRGRPRVAAGGTGETSTAKPDAAA